MNSIKKKTNIRLYAIKVNASRYCQVQRTEIFVAIMAITPLKVQRTEISSETLHPYPKSLLTCLFHIWNCYLNLDL
jgi:hypothetical protein